MVIPGRNGSPAFQKIGEASEVGERYRCRGPLPRRVPTCHVGIVVRAGRAVSTRQPVGLGAGADAAGTSPATRDETGAAAGDKTSPAARHGASDHAASPVGDAGNACAQCAVSAAAYNDASRVAWFAS
jgi:hypothetical protein